MLLTLKPLQFPMHLLTPALISAPQTFHQLNRIPEAVVLREVNAVNCWSVYICDIN